MKGDAALRIENLTVRFGERAVIEDFSLVLKPGARAILTGRSGSGKSTILRCILGFTVPGSGAIHIDDEPLTGASVWRLRRKLAYVAQEPDLGSGIVREVLERPFTYRANVSIKKNLERVPELFRSFHLPAGLLDKDIVTLSGGEKQRVAFIASVLLDRRLFLLDEAASALDQPAKAAVVDFFRERDDLTVLFVAHNADEWPFREKVVELPGGDEGDAP